MPKARSAYVISLKDGQTAFAIREVEEPLVRFFEAAGGKDDPSLGNELFACWVHRSAFSYPSWKRVRAFLPPPLDYPPTFFKPDMLAQRVHLYRNSTEAGQASISDIDSLEPAAVWEAEQLDSRLSDALSGTPNIWMEDMRRRARELAVQARGK